MVNIVLKLYIRKLTVLMYFLTAVSNAQVFSPTWSSEPPGPVPRPAARRSARAASRPLTLRRAGLDVDGFRSFLCFYLIQGFYAMTRFIFLLHMGGGGRGGPGSCRFSPHRLHRPKEGGQSQGEAPGTQRGRGATAAESPATAWGRRSEADAQGTRRHSGSYLT